MVNVNDPRSPPGMTLTAMWTVVEVGDSGEGVLALVGEEERVSAFLVALQGPAAQLMRERLDRRMVTLLGAWPFERACDLVRAINAPGSSPQTWARTVEQKVLHDPQRRVLEEVDDELVTVLLTAFDEAVERSETDG